jgi:hypothetical protein
MNQVVRAARMARVLLKDALGQRDRLRARRLPLCRRPTTQVIHEDLPECILIAGTGRVELEDSTRALIAGADKPTKIQVFSTPT